MQPFIRPERREQVLSPMREAPAGVIQTSAKDELAVIGVLVEIGLAEDRPLCGGPFSVRYIERER
jgi:hypothetical protein